MTRLTTTRGSLGLVAAMVALTGCGTPAPGSESQAADPSEPPFASATQPAPPGPVAPEGPAAADSTEPPAIVGLPTGFQALAAELLDDAEGPAGTVNVERLMDVLPEVDGWTRSRHRGERLAAPVGHGVAAARYERDAWQVEIEVVDTASRQALLAPYAMFLIPGFEERSEDGLRRAFTLRDSPAFEHWNPAASRGEVVLVINKRFLVKGTGRRVPNIGLVRQMMERMNLSTLERIR